jgi:hypothetical protein
MRQVSRHIEVQTLESAVRTVTDGDGAVNAGVKTIAGPVTARLKVALVAVVLPGRLLLGHYFSHYIAGGIAGMGGLIDRLLARKAGGGKEEERGEELHRGLEALAGDERSAACLA